MNAELLGGGSGDDGDGAEQAFEALRAEVSSLRHQLELVYRQGEQQAREASTALVPDYTLTLGKMEKALGVIATRLAAVEGQPALQLSGAELRREMASATQAATGAMDRVMDGPLREMRAATAKMEDLVGQARKRVEQRKWLWAAASGGAIVGMALWVMLAAVLPWGMGDWMASLPISGGNRWGAGQALLSRDHQQSWNKMARLYNACGDRETELCEAAITVRTLLPLGQEEKAPVAAPVTAPAPPARQLPRKSGQSSQ